MPALLLAKRKAAILFSVSETLLALSRTATVCEFDGRPSVGHVFTFSQPLSGVLLARLENVEKICGMPVDDVAVSRFFADIL